MIASEKAVFMTAHTQDGFNPVIPARKEFRMIKTLLTLITFSIMLAGCARPEVTRHTMPVTVTGPVRTAYHDLPADQMRRLRILLDAEDLSALDEESCRILLEHARAALLTGRSPFGPSISANYFWNIYLQLPVFVDPRERHQGYYKDEKRSLPDARLLAYACYRLDRSPENLRRIFSRVQPVLVQTVPREMYVHANAPDYIAGLLYAYRELQNLSGSHARLAEFYESVYYRTRRGAA
jgi:hypothetical protein